MKKKMIIIPIITLAMGTTAMAANKWTSVFKHGSIEAQGALYITWQSGNNYDYGKVATSFQNGTHKGYKVTTYIEAIKGEKVTQTSFKHDYSNAIVSELAETSASRFGSTHTIAVESNVHSAVSLKHLSD